MAGLLAWRNLAHDRSRFAVTLIGIIFAVVLIAMQIGLFLGFSDSTTNVIRHTRADFWIVAKSGSAGSAPAWRSTTGARWWSGSPRASAPSLPPPGSSPPPAMPSV
ncbi:hypothetical protein [Candidatus Thiodictyon syntrophicum]|uniref:hypothetical protein n=1 Tax=Candidatus Thiodictyon syntrophicum TaxID=1166950 RepID=UPI001C12B4EC|nr:hypothetical protein [Candidatus Thiodictyon syntrophicum]